MDDRNFDRGGRSFYFFDFDDNVMCLETEIYIFNVKTGEEKSLSTQEFAVVSPTLGKEGPYADYKIDFDDEKGSFRKFRDEPNLPSDEQTFVKDLIQAVQSKTFKWRGPSWEIFCHAVNHDRPVAIITARGHEPNTIRRGIFELVKRRLILREPNYVKVIPVTHPKTMHALGGSQTQKSIAELKHGAIVESVRIAMERYGLNPFHRFGVSDDSQENLELIINAMHTLKGAYPDNAFFAIDTSGGGIMKNEVLKDTLVPIAVSNVEQLAFF